MPAAKKPAKTTPKAKPAAKKPAASRPTAKKAAPAAAKAAPKAGPKAPIERFGAIEVAGKPATVIGEEVKVGQKAPHFKAQVGSWLGLDIWSEIDPLEVTRGQVRVLAAVPSLDTAVCDLETRRFNAEAVNLGEAVRIITLSTDLPVAQKRWCGAAGVERVVAVSDHMATEFGINYGALIKERRWLRRAVFVVDQADVLRYVAYMPKTSEHPDYDGVLAVVRQLLAA
jgi:thioredoxin-dependent peroxiredoxin